MATKTKSIPLSDWTKIFFTGSVLSFVEWIGAEMDGGTGKRAIVKVQDKTDGKVKLYTISPRDVLLEDWFLKTHKYACTSSHFTKTGSFVIVTNRRL